ncbi:hypothetical protein F2P56_017013, partial [Juglans regia]
ATPFLAGLAVAAAALAGRYGIQAWQTFKARPPKPRMRKFYEGGFQPTMTKREAALILGIRENATPDKVKEVHRRVMVANHPDAGGSHYLASKINEAKDVMLGKTESCLPMNLCAYFEVQDWNSQILLVVILLPFTEELDYSLIFVPSSIVSHICL